MNERIDNHIISTGKILENQDYRISDTSLQIPTILSWKESIQELNKDDKIPQSILSPIGHSNPLEHVDRYQKSYNYQEERTYSPEYFKDSRE